MLSSYIKLNADPMRSFLIYCLFSTLVVAPAFAQKTNQSSILIVAPEPEQSAGGLKFLRLGTQASGLGLGDAYTAQATGVSAIYYNPANLIYGDKNEVALTHHKWIAGDILYTLAGRIKQNENTSWGISATAYSIKDLEARTQPGPSTGKFSVQYSYLALAWARKVGLVNVGITAKYIREQLFDQSANGFAFDAGVQSEFMDHRLKVGVVAHNVLGKMSALELESTPQPQCFSAGMAVLPLRIHSTDDEEPLLDLWLSADVEQPLNDAAGQDLSLAVGLDAIIFGFGHIRMGYRHDDALRPLSFGAGMAYQDLKFDYAFIPFESGFGSGHVLTLGYRL